MSQMEGGGCITDRVPDGRRGRGGTPTPVPGPSPRSEPHARDPWSPPSGRELLAGIAVLAVLVAALVVFRSDFPPASRDGGAAPFALRAAAASAAPPPPVPWSEVPLARTVSELPRDLVGPVYEGIAEARDRIARCVALERRRAPSSAPATGRDGGADVVARPAARAGAVQVEGIEVTSAGGAPDMIACARRLLDGATFPASAVVPGWRQRLAVPLE